MFIFLCCIVFLALGILAFFLIIFLTIISARLILGLRLDQNLKSSDLILGLDNKIDGILWSIYRSSKSQGASLTYLKAGLEARERTYEVMVWDSTIFISWKQENDRTFKLSITKVGFRLKVKVIIFLLSAKYLMWLTDMSNKTSKSGQARDV